MITNQLNNRARREKKIDANTEIKENRVNAPYREAVGSLLYLAGATRPDISYAVNVLSRHQLNPTKEDWKMVERVFCYLKHTKTLKLTYKGETDEIVCFSDASFADCKGSLTTCGFVIQLFGDPITWRTRKQKYVAMSTCQAEYVAMSDASMEMVSIYNSLSLIMIEPPLPMILKYDNIAAGKNAQTSGGNKLRHMLEIKEHYIKECVQRKLVKLQWVESKEQIADIFTKPLSFESHIKLTNKLMNIDM